MNWVPATEVAMAEAPAESGFAALGLPPELVRALAGQGIVTPFPIQQATIGDALAGRDLLGRGRTGSGKTLGFGLPMLARLDQDDRLGVRGLVLVPTRELALQVADVLAPLAQALTMSVALVAGGMAYGPQIRAFERGVDVVVATPGRLVDLIEQGAADLSTIQVTVIDEADHMAELGFWEAVTTIVDATPSDGQRLLFSATLDTAVDDLVQRYLHQPVTHEVDPQTASVATMEHIFWMVAAHQKNQLVNQIAAAGRDRTLVFVRTQQGADRVAERLRGVGILAGALHGGLRQGARARILAAFRDGSLPVLVATDVAARGIHVDDVALVVQADPPASSKDYLHRAGRTARAGSKGVVLSVLLRHQRRLVSQHIRHTGLDARFVQVTPGDETVTGLVGSWVEREPILESDYQALIAPRPAGRRPRRGPGPGRSRRRHFGS